MAKRQGNRRDSKHRVLRRGESIRADGKYQFKYHINGKPHFVYSWRLEPTDKLPVGKKPCLSLRELEKQIGYDLDTQMDPMGKNITVEELVERYLRTKTGVRDSTRAGYKTVQRILQKEAFGGKKISQVKDIDLENRIINIDHQLLRTSEMKYVIEATKTNAGTRKLPMTEDVFRCFQAIIEDREKPRFEKIVDDHTGFLFTDKDGMPLVAMHWEHRFNNMVKRYNDIFRVQMPNVTPHVCRHTYRSNMAKSGMNPKTLQYLMGHSDIGVTLNTYTHLGLEDAADELKRMEELADARKELEKVKGVNPVSQKMFRAN